MSGQNYALGNVVQESLLSVQIYQVIWLAWLNEAKPEHLLENNNHICKNVFASLLSVFNIISLSRHEQVCLMRLEILLPSSSRIVITLKLSDDGRSISRKVISLNVLVHDLINLVHYNSADIFKKSIIDSFMDRPSSGKFACL